MYENRPGQLLKKKETKLINHKKEKGLVETLLISLALALPVTAPSLLGAEC